MPKHACICTQSNTVGGGTYRVVFQTANTQEEEEEKLVYVCCSSERVCAGAEHIHGMHSILMPVLFYTGDANRDRRARFLLQHLLWAAMIILV